MQPSNDSTRIIVRINDAPYDFEVREQTAHAIKERASIPHTHILCLTSDHCCYEQGDETPCEHNRGELVVIQDCDIVILESGQHFWSHGDEGEGVLVEINRTDYRFQNPIQTGRSLKERAGIPLSDVLFRHLPNEDQVIPDDVTFKLHCGDCFHSAPPANYGGTILPSDVGFDQFELFPQPEEWVFLVIPDYQLPDGFVPEKAKLLLKLPPMFPDAAPDMFWLAPQVKTATGGAPQGTSPEMILGTQWQRFSWHLATGAWRPGISSLRDFMRSIRARLEKRN